MRLTYCDCKKNSKFASSAAFYAHLESGSCSQLWSAKHVNAMVSRSPGSSAYVIDDRRAWLLAGAPRTEARSSDHGVCPLCKEPHPSQSALTQHLQQSGCYEPYPNVLKCPNCTTGFKKLSLLIAHVETNTCPASIQTGEIGMLLDYIEANLSRPSLQSGLSAIEYDLQCDPNQPRKLIVKVASVTDLISM